MIVFDWDAESSGTGPIFGGESEDLDFTLLRWRVGQGVAEHVSTEVDVLMIVFSGDCQVIVDGQTHEVSRGKALLVPKDTRRAIKCLSDDVCYLNVHKRRKRLTPGPISSRPGPVITQD